ncbi:DUF779 domain-containing protein [Mycolicibacterium komossense]|uniref:DUF779 domain-containing protein n=1 Tax=Mycolicibacterium komossense TaxID=1779 RepID=A0ABT3CD23_9MYCO|nr:DUF779 domain-containing protein [Mycolicibacterium komossense]
MPDAPSRALITAAAVELLTTSQERHGALMFHQSGGCCDRSSPADVRFLTGGGPSPKRKSEPLQAQTPVTGAQAGVAFERGGRIPNTGSSVVADVVEACPVR